jgi:predicted RNA polymerase sigma factor
VAVSMAVGPAAGLALVDQLAAEPTLRNYHLLPSVRGDLLLKLGRAREAEAEFWRASELTRNARERELSAQRARSAGAQAPGTTADGEAGGRADGQGERPG